MFANCHAHVTSADLLCDHDGIIYLISVGVCYLHESNINQPNPTTHPTTTQIPPVRVDAKRYVMASSRRIQDIILTLSYRLLCLFQRLHFSLTWFFKFPARREASAFGFQTPLSHITVLICDAASPFSFVVEAPWTWWRFTVLHWALEKIGCIFCVSWFHAMEPFRREQSKYRRTPSWPKQLCFYPCQPSKPRTESKPIPCF